MRYCLLERDSQHAKFQFRLENFSTLQEHCISKVFRFGGNYWKLQVSKKEDYLGMYLRWYGTTRNPQPESELKVTCSVDPVFAILNIFFPRKTIVEGSRGGEKETFTNVTQGIGYSEMTLIEELERHPGYILSDCIYLHLEIKLLSTVYVDKLPCTVTEDFEVVCGKEFQFFGTIWKLLFFPKGEAPLSEIEVEENKENENEDKEENESENNNENENESENESEKKSESENENKSENENETENENEDEENENENETDSEDENSKSEVNENSYSAIYLYRDGEKSTGRLRHNVQFRISVVGRSDLVFDQHFYYKESNVYGTSSFIPTAILKEMDSLEVSVSFEHVIPYTYFAYRKEDISDSNVDHHFIFEDHLRIPWSFTLFSPDTENFIKGSLTMDPEKSSKEVASLNRKKKSAQVCWLAELLSPLDIEQSVVFTTISKRRIKDFVFDAETKQDTVEFPVQSSKVGEEVFLVS